MSKELESLTEFAFSVHTLSDTIVERIFQLTNGKIDCGDGFDEVLEIYFEMVREILIIAATKTLESENLNKFYAYLEELEMNQSKGLERMKAISKLKALLEDEKNIN